MVKDQLERYGNLSILNNKIRNCGDVDCPRYDRVLQRVPGEGLFFKEIVLIGEAPGATEDREGRPFVGRSGQLLDKVLEKTGWSRDDFYITNIVKCRPHNNNKPSDELIEGCSQHYLWRELGILKAKIVVPMGSTAWNVIQRYGEFRSITKDRGKLHTRVSIGCYSKIAFPMFHPSYCLRNRRLIEVLEEDFTTLHDKLERLK